MVQFAKKHTFLPFIMWFFPLLFFTYQFILRLWPGLMMQQIMSQFSVDASHFGVIAAFYYYGYAGMQIPVALLLDRFGTRSIIFIFAMLCGLATLLFTYSSHWYVACLSRFLVGAGSAVGFLGVSKVISEWFPAERYTKMVGFSFTIGLMGAIYGGKPISILIETYAWQQVAVMLAFVALVIGFCAYFVLRPKPHSDSSSAIKNNEQLRLGHLKTLLLSPEIWLLAIANLLMVGTLEGFSDVWGVPYLMNAYSLNKSTAAQLLSFVYFGMLFGGPLLAGCSKKLGNYTVITLSGLGMMLAFAILMLSREYHWGLLAGLFFTMGILCCYQVIVFAAGSELVNPAYFGVTVAFLNCMNMLGGSFFHTVIGKLIDQFSGVDGVGHYSFNTYQWALPVIPICSCLGAVITCYLGLKLNRKLSLKKKLFRKETVQSV